MRIQRSLSTSWLGVILKAWRHFKRSICAAMRIGALQEFVSRIRATLQKHMNTSIFLRLKVLKVLLPYLECHT